MLGIYGKKIERLKMQKARKNFSQILFEKLVAIGITPVAPIVSDTQNYKISANSYKFKDYKFEVRDGKVR